MSEDNRRKEGRFRGRDIIYIYMTIHKTAPTTMYSLPVVG